jgi:hypothetical protein
MTVREFDARASFTRGVSSRQDRAPGRLFRTAWLLGRIVRREPVAYELYRARFGRPVHAFHGDLAALRAARIYRGTELLGS